MYNNISFDFIHSDSKGHKFITTTNKPLNGAVTQCALLIVRHYLELNYSLKEWRKEKRLFHKNYFFNEKAVASKGFNYLIISEYLREKGQFEPRDFQLYDLGEMWLDHASGFKMNFHKSEESGETFGLTSGDLQTHYYGQQYPIKPMLHREGILYTSIQPNLILQIMKRRDRLIDLSEDSLTDDWVFDLRTLISDSISLIDICLTQLYIKAEFDPLPGWRFDKKVLGERHGRRLNDKLKWVYQITGNALNIESEQKSLNTLRELRNHFMHFDPPSLVITLEEATQWLNQVIDIGKILIKIRNSINVRVSNELINFLLQREAVFSPFDKKAKRRPLNSDKNEDYYSSIWPS